MTAASDQIKTTVVIPVYNAERYLEECLDSVFAQTQDHFEVVCVDDGSTDSSPGILERYWQRHENMRVITQGNRCLGGARNTGARAARGTYLYFLDADDLADPSLLDTCYEFCEENALECASFDSEGFVVEEGVRRSIRVSAVHDRSCEGIEAKTWSGVDYWQAGYGKGHVLYPCWTYFIRRDFFTQNGLWFEENVFFEDNDWLFRLYKNLHALRYLPCKLHEYRWHPQSITHRACSVKHICSCMRVNDALVDLYRATCDERERAMLMRLFCEGVRRLGHLYELESCDDLGAVSHEFAQRLIARIDAEQDDTELLCTQIALLRVIVRQFGFSRELIRLFPHERLLLSPGKRIGVYGTGKRTDMAFEAFDSLCKESHEDAGSTLVFFESKADGSKTYRGTRVVDVGQARDAQLDAVIIFSTSYANEMMRTVRTVWGEAMPVVVVGHESIVEV